MPEKTSEGVFTLVRSKIFGSISLLELCRDLHYPEESVKQIWKVRQYKKVDSIINNIFVISDRFIMDVSKKWETNVILNLICRLMTKFGDNYSVCIFRYVIHH